jgi:hypothetical protein
MPAVPFRLFGSLTGLATAMAIGSLHFAIAGSRREDRQRDGGLIAANGSGGTRVHCALLNRYQRRCLSPSLRRVLVRRSPRLGSPYRRRLHQKADDENH